MNDQARFLREQVAKYRNHPVEAVEKEARTIAVVSGKGGVGKSNFSLNFSLILQNKGYKVLLFDLDIGMANIDILMGITQKYSIVHLFEDNVRMEDIIHPGPEGLSYIAGGSGLTDIFKLDERKREFFLSQLEETSSRYDFIILDMGAGISDESLQLLLAVDEMILLTTCEPTSLTDAYSALKFITKHNNTIPFHIIINKVYDSKTAIHTAERLQAVSKQFLTKDLHHLGSIPDDKYVSLAVMDQTPFVLKYPTCPASKEMKRVTYKYLENHTSSKRTNASSFITRLLRYFSK